jgi:hypothetical protein
VFEISLLKVKIELKDIFIYYIIKQR